jgi:hypothetical protein
VYVTNVALVQRRVQKCAAYAGRALFEFITAARIAESRARLNSGLSNAGRASAITPSASSIDPAAKPLVPLPWVAQLLLQRGAVTADRLAAAEYGQRGGRSALCYCGVAGSTLTVATIDPSSLESRDEDVCESSAESSRPAQVAKLNSQM